MNGDVSTENQCQKEMKKKDSENKKSLLKIKMLLL